MTHANLKNIQPNSSELAIYWASQGYQVFPVGKDKKPSQGYLWGDYPISDPEMIRLQWQNNHKQCGVGIITGKESNLLVLDIDNKNGAKGSQSLKELESKYGDLPKTFTVKTPGGGHHYYFRYNDCGLTIDAGVMDGVDYRGEGGYVVSAGSVVQGGVYLVENDVPVADAPAWLIDVLRREKKQEVTPSSSNRKSGLPVEGNRNTYLASIAGSLRRKGMGREEIEQGLLGINSTFELPLPAQEVQNIAKSISKYNNSDWSIYAHEQDFAERLANKYNGQIRYVSGIGFHINENGVWLRDNEDLKTKRLLQESIIEACQEIERIAAVEEQAKVKDKILRLRGKLKKRSFQTSCLDFVKSHPLIVTYADDLDQYEHIIGLSDGVFDMNTSQYLDEPETYLITKRLDVSYDSDATCPIFDQMMETIFPDVELRTYVLKNLGYALCGTNNEKTIFICVGKGDNGKTTLIEIISSLFSDYAVTLDPSSFIRKMGNSISNDIARLRGARLCVTSETSAGAIFDTALVKRLSGKDAISARYLMQEYFEFYNHAVIFMLSNFIPVFDGSDTAMANRVKIVPFSVSIAKEDQDKDLAQKLEGEKQGIFNRLLEARNLYLKEGLELPTAVKEATERFCNQSNLIKQFADEHMACDPNSYASVSTVYTQYTQWCNNRGYKPLSENIFSTAFEDHMKSYKKRRAQGYVWEGIKITNHVPFFL